MPKERQLGLLANLRRVQAQDQIFRGQIDALDYDGIHDLFMAAYGDEELAKAEKIKALQRLVRTSTESVRVNQ